jgi:hypothetical protein
MSPHRYALLVLVISSASVRADDFAHDIRPILDAHCIKCHGPQKQKGGVRLDVREDAVKPGDSGIATIVPRNAAKSELVRRITSKDPAERMPPKSPPLSAKEIETLTKWIDAGAAWDDKKAAAATREMVVTDEDRKHWAYPRLKPVELPAVKRVGWVRTPIDRFILAALEAKGLEPTAKAEPRKLVRRLTFDVNGLPPTLDEIQSLTADPASYETLIDRLLASRHYGERWARHWLDIARYADSNGQEQDADRPNAYHYRDFVIKALNEDMAYEQFVRLQIAGDEIAPGDPLALAATGFLAAGPNTILDDKFLEEERLRNRYNELDNIVSTIGTGLLAVSIGCARCHDHKYDAIPTRDYYRLLCSLTAGDRREHPLVGPEDQAKHAHESATWKRNLTIAQESLKAWLAENRRIVEPAAKELAKRRGSEKPNDEEYRLSMSEAQRAEWKRLEAAVKTVDALRPAPLPAVLGYADKKPQPPPNFLFNRGEFMHKKEPVTLGFLGVLSGDRTADDYLALARKASQAASTQQRHAMANWLVDVDEGAGSLLARVIVNRVWQHHFGEGLVRTVDDFGVQGERPSHPELLEWLAHDFVTNGWKLKRLHRMILTSATYQQAATFDDAKAKIDPDNRLLWRQRTMRIEAESLRDAILAVSGTLNLEPYGPGFKPPIPSDAIVARNTTNPYPKDVNDTPETRRRSIYMFRKRVVQHPLIITFDGTDTTVSCGKRNRTTVAPQALLLLNDSWIRSRAEDFAGLLEREANDPGRRVEIGFERALGRSPTDDEKKACLEFLASQTRARRERPAATDFERPALADFCQSLFALNEFVYID